jgi:cobalt-zinc-cadmium efflux system outer membrane protein
MRNPLLLLLLLCALPLSSVAQTLTEAETLRLGLARPEFSELQRAHVEEAEADVLEAGTWPNPTLEFTREKLGSEREKSWQLAQPFDLSGRRGLREDAARHRVRASEADNLGRRDERRAPPCAAPSMNSCACRKRNAP